MGLKNKFKVGDRGEWIDLQNGAPAYSTGTIKRILCDGLVYHIWDEGWKRKEVVLSVQFLKKLKKVKN